MHKLKRIKVTNIIGKHTLLESYTDNDLTISFATSLLKDISELYLDVLVSMVSIDVIELEGKQYQLIYPNPLFDFLRRIERFDYCSINARIHMFDSKKQDKIPCLHSIEKQFPIDDEARSIIIALLIKFSIEVPYYKNAGVQLFNRIEAIKKDGKSLQYLTNISNKLLADIMKKKPSSIRAQRQ